MQAKSVREGGGNGPIVGVRVLPVPVDRTSRSIALTGRSKSVP
jgi:hypothetical protein